MIAARPLLLHNTIQHYEWGTRNADAFLPKFLAIPTQPDLPYAELWIGAHPKAPSSVMIDGDHVPLTTLIESSPVDVLGETGAAKFSSRLPFLLKVLSAGEPLSIQAHPNKAQARLLHARDPLNYPDDNHKPEIAVALDELKALAGFKPFDDIVAEVRRYPLLAEAAGTEAAAQLRAGTSDSPGIPRDAVLGSRERRRALLKDFYRSLMTRVTADPAELTRTIDGIAAQMRRQTPTKESLLFLATQRRYPGDVGLLSILLLNIVRLRRGEGMFIGAGIPHAYLKGTIVECMANSDNVVRAGLTPKFKDVDTLCDILTYECGAPAILRPPSGGRVTEYAAPVAEFSLSRRQMAKSELMSLTGRTSAELLLLTDGAVTVTWGAGHISYKRGDAVLLPAALGACELRAETDTELFSVTLP
jgi:mannose-6-phosphate isomerase